MTKDGFETIAFRVPTGDFHEFRRICKDLFNAGKLKEPKPSVLAKTFLYVMANQYRMLESQAEAILRDKLAESGMNQGPS